MILKNYKIRRFRTETGKWDILELTQAEYLIFIKEKYRLPGEFNLDSRVNIILEPKLSFTKWGYYCDYPEDSSDYDEYWEEEAFKCVHGVLVDDFFVTGAHYMYVNFMQINDKVKGIQFFPNFWDSDIWFFYCLDIAQLTDKDLAIVKKRQFGSSYKLAAYAIRQLWFASSKVCKVFNVDQTYVEDFFSFMDDYKQFLNEHTAWYRPFSPEEKLYWKQQQEISSESNDGKRTTKQGRKNVVKGVTTQKKPSAIVSGACSLYVAEEAGKNPTLDKSYNFAQKAMRFGNIKTGFFIASGSVGSMAECEPLKKFILYPKANGFLEFPNVWSNRPDEMIGMFVPEYYSYGDCIDEWGNSLIELANQKIDEWLESIKEKSIPDYLAEISQAPRTIEQAFNSQETNFYPTEIIQPHYEKLCRESSAIRVTLIDDGNKITHKLGSEAPPVTDFPIKKDTDKRGCVELVEPPLYDNPPIGLYYGSCDPVTQIKTQTSDSLQSFYIYRADFYQNDVLVPGELVAWYTGRYDNVDTTYEICRKLMKYYNARTMIESDKDGFIKWLINKKENLYIMKRSEYPRLQEIVPNSKVFEDYGIRKGSSKTFELHLHETIIRYISEEIGTDYDKEGNSRVRYGVERIKDKMLLREMLDYNSRVNVDRCFIGTTNILTERGYVNIKDVNVGDKVLTHTDTFKKVTELFYTKKENLDLYNLKILGNYENLACTENHPFLVKNITKGSGKYWHKNTKISEPYWKLAKDLTTKDYLIFPKRLNLENNPLSKELLYILGWYLSDGYRIKDKKRFTIALQEDQLHIAEYIKELLLNIEDFTDQNKFSVNRKIPIITKSKAIYKDREVKVYVLSFTSYVLSEIIDKYVNTEEHNYKSLKPTLFNCNNMLPLVLGFFEGDGHLKRNTKYDNSTRFSLAVNGTNKLFFKQLRQILIDNSIWCTEELKLYKYKNDKFNDQVCINITNYENIEKIIDCMGFRSLKFQNTFNTFNVLDKKVLINYVVDEGTHFLVPLRKIDIKQEKEIEVYNLEVDEDHTYNSNNIITHNCMAFAYVLDVAEGNTIRQRIQKIKEDKVQVSNTKISISQFNQLSLSKKLLKIKQF